MAKYNENDLYDRCGATDIPIDPNREPVFKGEFGEVDGLAIPVIYNMFQSGVEFTREICLKTKYGYIPIDNIEKFKDIFDSSKYCQDETEWTILYDEERASDDTKQRVRRLSLALGKHWNGK